MSSSPFYYIESGEFSFLNHLSLTGAVFSIPSYKYNNVTQWPSFTFSANASVYLSIASNIYYTLDSSAANTYPANKVIIQDALYSYSAVSSTLDVSSSYIGAGVSFFNINNQPITTYQPLYLTQGGGNMSGVLSVSGYSINYTMVSKLSK
jgi:hypothetical protein